MGYRDKPRSYENESFSAVCDECGKKCEVPFRPTSGKPVYCSDCYKNKQKSNSRNSDRPSFRNDSRSSFRGGRDDNRSNFKDRRMYSAVCDSCGKKCEVPFQPTSGKPVYCDNCFGKDGNSKRGTSGSGDNNQLKEQITSINRKLDKIMTALAIGDKQEDSKKDKKVVIEEVSVEKAPKKRKKAISRKSSAKKSITKKVAAKKTSKKAIKKVVRKKPVKKAAKKKVVKK